MPEAISPRLLAIARALPLRPGIRVLEIGCGPGALARYLASQPECGYILAIDRSAKAIAAAQRSQGSELTGRLEFRCCAVEDFELQSGDTLFDLAVAVRVGALDGRHPEVGRRALAKIAAGLTEKGRLFIDGGHPLHEITLP